MKSLLLFLLTVGLYFTCYSQWQAQNYDTPVCTAETFEGQHMSISDGRNGSIVLIENSVYKDDDRTFQQLVAQRIDADGIVRWGNVQNPRLVCDADTNEIFLTDAIPDETGGAFVTYEKERSDSSYDVYIQHLDANGNTLWSANGRKVSLSNTTSNYESRICLDGNGGVIITWTQNRSKNIDGYEYSIYSKVFAQRLNVLGNNVWSSTGVQLCSANGLESLPQIVSDGNNGAIVLFTDTRHAIYDSSINDYDNYDIFAQRINSLGNLAWSNQGVVVTDQIYNQVSFDIHQSPRRIASDSAGGAIIVFDNSIDGNAFGSDLYAQKINNNGVRQWGQNGIEVKRSNLGIEGGNVSSDGQGGFVIVWDESDPSPTTSINTIFAQRISAKAIKLWLKDGIRLDHEIRSASDGREDKITMDGQGNFVITWISYTNISLNLGSIIKAQKITGIGSTAWAGEGILVNTIDDYAYNPDIVTSDNGATIIVWGDDRDDTPDIYANKILADGTLATSGRLPLKLIEFTANKIKQGIELNWITENELNTKYFLIEKSIDGFHFNSVSTTMAYENASIKKYYSLIDHNPFNGVSYYRLKTIDKDGTSVYSMIRKVNVEQVSGLKIKLLKNPIEDKAILNLTTDKNTLITYNLLNMTGQALVKGTKQLKVGQQQLVLKTDNLPAGIYEIIIQTNKENILVPFIK